MRTRTEHDPEVARRGSDLARALNGLGLVDRRLRDVACPWCRAPAGRPCVIAATDRPLVHVPAHSSRYRAAGIDPPLPVIPAEPVP